MELSIAILPGDGVGPEIVAEGVKTLRAIGRRFNHSFTFRNAVIGATAFEQVGEALQRKPWRSAKHPTQYFSGR